MFHVESEPIKSVPEVNDLGVIIKTGLGWSLQTAKAVNRANSALY